MTYDLGRLAGHRLISSIPRSHRYRLTADGLRISAFLTKLADRILALLSVPLGEYTSAQG